MNLSVEHCKLKREQRTEKKYWQNPVNIQQYLTAHAKTLSYNELNDLYHLKASDLRKNQGGGLLDAFNGSISAIINFAFPEQEWFPWCFRQVPKYYWNDSKNIRKYMVWLGEKFGYKSPEDFYQVDRNLIKQHDGSGLLSLNNGSVTKIIMLAFPEYDYKEWLFIKAPQGFWNNKENRLRYLKWFEERLQLSNLNS